MAVSLATHCDTKLHPVPSPTWVVGLPAGAQVTAAVFAAAALRAGLQSKKDLGPPSCVATPRSCRVWHCVPLEQPHAAPSSQHAPAQPVRPWGQHTPSPQASPSAQAWPQVPQCFASRWVSVHAASHTEGFEGGQTQKEALHTSFCLVQATVQLPQCAGSFWRSAQLSSPPQ